MVPLYFSLSENEILSQNLKKEKKKKSRSLRYPTRIFLSLGVSRDCKMHVNTSSRFITEGEKQ